MVHRHVLTSALVTLLMVATMVMVAACGDLASCEVLDTCEATDSSPVSEAVLHTDPNDAIFFEATLTDGRTLIVAGPKDAEGLPTGVSEMTLVSTDGNDTTQFFFDDTDRLSTIVTDEGMIDVEYLDETRVILTAVDLDTGDEERVNFTLDQPQSMVGTQGVPTTAPEGATLYGTVSETVVNVTRCGGEPNDDGCPVTLSGTIDGKAFKSVPRCGGLGTGTYPFPMPGTPTISVNQSTLCNIAAFFTRKAVLAVALFKPGCALFIETGVGVAICVVALNGVESLIDALGVAPTGGPGRWLCSKTAGTVDWGGTVEPGVTSYSLTATAKYINDLKTETVTGTLASDGRWPDIDIEFPTGSNRISVEPADPIPGQSYVAYGHVECVPDGATVVLSVSGTDGYDNQTAQTLSAGGTLSLSVPGGGASVVDTLRVTVNGTKVKETEIVF